jgi:hypothetical protein
VLLGLAVLLAVLRPPPALRVGGWLYLVPALLTFVVTPAAMVALLGASDRVLRDEPATEGLLETVKSRYLHLLAANGAVAVTVIGVNIALTLLLVVVVLVVGAGAIGVGSLLSSPAGVAGSGADGVLAGLGVVAIVAYGGMILLTICANAAVDFVFRFVKPSVVVGETGVVDALVESYRLVREHPRVALGYYLVQRTFGLLLGGLVVLAGVGLFSVGSLASNPLSASDSGLVAVVAIVLVAYTARSITYAVTLPYTVNVYQYLRYVSDRTD